MIYEKLLKVQMEIGAIKKDSENPLFKSKYFDINSLLAVVKPVLNKHGLVLTQGLTHINGKLALETRLSNVQEMINGLNQPISPKLDGEIFNISPLPEGLDAQKTGSAITYFRRYALQSLLALEADDDDANYASGKVEKVDKMKKNGKDTISRNDSPFGTNSNNQD